jgi:signal transduction histidine kinase
LASVVTDLLSGRDLTAVLPTVVRQARDIVEADGAAVALPVGEHALSVAYVDGFGAPELLGLEVPVNGTLLGAALQRGLLLQSEQLATDPRLSFRHPLVERVGPAGYVPLGRPASAHGVLFVYNTLGRAPFDHRATTMLDAFASQVAVAMELAERRHDATRLALLEDRGRIARDLHDVVIQRLFAIGLTLEGITPSVADHDAANSLTRAIDDIDQTIKEIRSTIFGLQGPAVPEYSSLRARIVGVVDQAMHSLGFVPSLRFEGLLDTSVPGRLSDQVVAVLREALSNAARHAHAAGVDVKLSVTPERLTLLVDDDGIGIRNGGRRSGLRNMEVRAAAYGGRLVVEPREPFGTHLEWTVPLRPPS